MIAVEMPDGSPHAATVHFAHKTDPLTFILQTSPHYRKSRALFHREFTRASLVIGLEEVPEGKNKTLQLDGNVRLIRSGEESFKEIYFQKFSEKIEKATFSDDIFFIFVPSWWRFTDWSKPEGKTIYTSDGQMLVNGTVVSS